MSTKLLSLSAAGNVALEVPGAISESMLLSNVIPLVVPIVKALAGTTGQIVQVVAKQIHETELQLTFYDKLGHEIENRVIPIIAETEALQLGLNIINNRGYDARLRKLAEKKLLSGLDVDK